ncbi:hypothetical protein QBC46DRAFT_396957 [Diplogelasinospora grovesii]|uniref:Uncharacterized protein n=1 Tax=Diplogelasinospora grovesii TaxID=303347 RepID=A0AAN6N0N9_9PEZI|nr:hypothetical protein QBC46DRAFT_396957 [Diplogelasinospora grovesii]
MYEIGWYVRWSARICNHRRWNTEYQFLLPNIANLAVKSDHYVRKDDTEKFAAFTLDPRSFCAATKALPNTKHITGTFDSRLHCALFHHSGCSCGANIQWGVVRSCDRCDTDFCFTVVTQGVPGEPKEESFWVFTSWRNMAAGVQPDDPVWQARVIQPCKVIWSVMAIFSVRTTSSTVKRVRTFCVQTKSPTTVYPGCPRL